jgi:hypothetical protein
MADLQGKVGIVTGGGTGIFSRCIRSSRSCANLLNRL